jgi:hypothetical protein
VLDGHGSHSIQMLMWSGCYKQHAR